MVTLGNKSLCSGCFSPIKKEPCKNCGFSEESYIPNQKVLPCGAVLMGTFLIGSVIGMGGFGITYHAYDVKFNKIIAIKEYFPSDFALRGSDGFGVMVSNRQSAEKYKHGAKKFYNEASLVSQLSGHPNIVRVYQFFYENNTAYFTMEYLEGMTLKDYVCRCGVLTAGQAANVAENVAIALREIHKHGILHRDVSPDNIMLCRDGSVKLLDFGAARNVLREGSMFMSVIVKPGFAPLEQYSSRGNQGAWTDIYSLGSSIFYALTKQIPENPQDRFAEDSLMDNSRYNIDPDLWNVIYNTMRLKETDRYQNADELIAVLNGVRIKRQEVKIPKIIPEATEAEKQNPIKQLIAKLFGGDKKNQENVYDPYNTK